MAETTNDNLKDYTVKCPECAEDFDAEIPIGLGAILETEGLSIGCPECGTESLIVYDAATGVVTLEAIDPDEGDDEDEDSDDDESEEDEDEEDE